jgi:hypothetical protein
MSNIECPACKYGYVALPMHPFAALNDKYENVTIGLSRQAYQCLSDACGQANRPLPYRYRL